MPRPYRRTANHKTKNISGDKTLAIHYNIPVEVEYKFSDAEKMASSLQTPSETEKEQLSLIHMKKNGNIIVFVQNSDENDSIETDLSEYTNSEYDDLSLIDDHNHPNNTPFSPNDIWLYLSQKKVGIGKCTTPKGDVFILIKSKKTPTNIKRGDFDKAFEDAFKKAEGIVSRMNPKEYPMGSYEDEKMAKFIVADKIIGEKYHMAWATKKRVDHYSAK